jgi:hypothetical protein
VLGPERLFGFGSPGAEHRYAELLTHVVRAPADGWRLASPHELDPAAPLADDGGPDVSWWLHGRSVRGSLEQ